MGTDGAEPNGRRRRRCDGVVVGEGFHARYGEAHAEVVALARRHAGERARGATMYVTLEPCAHHGKTPPCADALIAAGIARVVVAVRDPSAIARGGAERLRAAGVASTSAWSRTRRSSSTRRSSTRTRASCRGSRSSSRCPRTAPSPIPPARGAGSPAPSRAPRCIGCARTRDAIAVGIGTVLADDPRSRCAMRRRRAFRRAASCSIARSARRRRRCSFERARDVRRRSSPATGRALAAARRARGRRRRHRRGARSRSLDDVRVALRALRERGVRSLFVEGGPRLAGALLARRARRPPHYLSVTGSCLARWRRRRSTSRRPSFGVAARRCAASSTSRRFGDDVMTSLRARGRSRRVHRTDRRRRHRRRGRARPTRGASSASSAATTTSRRARASPSTAPVSRCANTATAGSPSPRSTTTLGRTTIGDWHAGRRVNLERALRVGDRLGGHFVQGHVDGVATVEDVRQTWRCAARRPCSAAGLAELMVQHGSVAVDGVSLTVNDLPARRRAPAVAD